MTIYIDTLFPQIYDEVLESLEKWVKIYVLRNLMMVKRFRDENNVGKSDENDAMILAKMPRTCFKELSVRDVTLLQLINGYEKFTKWKRIIRQWMNFYSLGSFKECVRELHLMHDRYGRRIIEEVMKDEGYAAIQGGM